MHTYWQVANWSEFVEPYLEKIQGHSQLRQFKFERNPITQHVEMFVKKTMLPEEDWKGTGPDGSGSGWRAFVSKPLPNIEQWPQLIPPFVKPALNAAENEVLGYDYSAVTDFCGHSIMNLT